MKIAIGCNYHTTWQTKKSMRFILVEVKDGKARLQTRNTCKNFWTNLSDLIFIESEHNKRKAENIINKGYIKEISLQFRGIISHALLGCDLKDVNEETWDLVFDECAKYVNNLIADSHKK